MMLTQENYVDRAEEAINRLIAIKGNSNPNDHRKQGKNKGKSGSEIVTTSKLRRLLSMTMDIYNQVLSAPEELTEEIRGRIEYLRVRMLYEAGRDKDVKAFLEAADLIDHLKTMEKSRSQYLLFVHYMEALVAFRKYLVEKDRDL